MRDVLTQEGHAAFTDLFQTGKTVNNVDFPLPDGPTIPVI